MKQPTIFPRDLPAAPGGFPAVGQRQFEPSRVLLSQDWQPGCAANGTLQGYDYQAMVGRDTGIEVSCFDPFTTLAGTIKSGNVVYVWQPLDANDGHYEPFSFSEADPWLFVQLDSDLIACGSCPANVLRIIDNCSVEPTGETVTLYDAFGMVLGSVLANDIDPDHIFIPSGYTAFVVPLGAGGVQGSGPSQPSGSCQQACPPCESAASGGGSQICVGSGSGSQMGMCHLYQPISFGNRCPGCPGSGSGSQTPMPPSSGGSSGGSSGPPPGSGGFPPCPDGSTPTWQPVLDCDGSPTGQCVLVCGSGCGSGSGI